MKKLLLAVTLSFLALFSVIVVRATRFTSRRIYTDPAASISIDSARAGDGLANALRFQTVSHFDPGQQNYKEFTELRAYLAETFPRVHIALSKERINEHSLLYTWSGTNQSLKPILLMGHVDVVPVEPGTESSWTYPPFSGRVADGYIWGRGALDNKVAVMAILEAVEHLIGEGFKPGRTVFLAFGHDEEIGGIQGGAAIARALQSHGVRLEYVLDEGGFIFDGVLPVSCPVAAVGIAEKGYVSLNLSVQSEGGHSSRPPRQTAVGILSTAIYHLEQNPFPGALRGPTREMFAYLGPEMPFLRRLIFANTWLFGPLVEHQMAASPTTDAMLRTTTAPTMLEGSVKDNVLPIRAKAVVNFRIFPGESIAGVIDHVRRAVDDPRVSVTQIEGLAFEAPPVSRTDTSSFEVLHRTIRQMYPNAVVTPYLLIATTDSRHYVGLTENIYRFLPLRVRPLDLERIHGTGERVSLRDYTEAITFYRQLILNSTP